MTIPMPLLWVVFPLFIAGLAGLLSNRKLLSILLTSLTAFSLSIFATLFSEELSISIGSVTLVFSESLNILGRQVFVIYEMMPYVALIYAVTGLWNLSSGIANIPQSFRSTSLVATALLTAALGVQPFLYAALLIETAVLVSIPTLSTPGQSSQPGILRYLTFQTLAMPLVLLAGWLLTGVETLPPDSPLITQTMVVLGLGIAIWLSVFPFHSWVPMLSQNTSPLVMSFLLFIMPTTILVFGLNFIDRFPFLRESEELFSALRLMGAIMIIINNAWTAVQHNLKRAFSYSALAETGYSLLAVGMYAQGGLTWMMLLFPVRALVFWLWGFTLTLIEEHTDSLEMNDVRGLGRRYPMLSVGLLLAQLSLAGLPLLAAFPVKISIYKAAFEVGVSLGILVFIGSMGLFLFTVRLLAKLIAPRDVTPIDGWDLLEKPYVSVSILVMILILIILGIFPNSFFSNIANTLAAFSQLK